jgi:OPA family sugar phosphate sensor protein UhpC-like MFS transporter
LHARNRSSLATSLFVWGVADLYFILSVTVAISFGIILPSIQSQIDLTAAQLGLLGFAFFITFGLMQFVAGSLIDARGSRITLAASALTAAGGLFLLSFADNFMWAMIAQMITGIGFSTAYVGAIYLAEKWFAKKQFALVSGITQMSANIVSALALFTMALAGVILVDFRSITMGLGCAALLLAALLLVIVRNVSLESRGERVKKSIFQADLHKLFCIPQFWLGVLYFSTNFGAFLAFSSLWNIPDSLAYGHSLKTATMMSATLRFGGAFGAIASGVLVRYLGRYSTLVKCYSTGSLVLGALLIYGPLFPVPLTFLIMSLLGFFCGGTALGFPLVARYIPVSLKGAGFGLMTSFGYLLCAVLEYLVGAFLNYVSLDAMTNEFKLVLTPLVLVLAIGWLGTLRLKEPAV